MALVVPAYAKLNLTLDVLGRRPTGYHDIDSVMQTVSLHDLLVVEASDCRVFDAVGRAVEGENLILKAARELEGRVSRQLPFTIRLYKRIPIGAGLGGGSADAAAFLKAANALYGLRLTTEELAEIGAEVGQDVPFFLTGGTARATGLGSTIEPISPVPSGWRFLVIAPPVQVSTRAVYEAVHDGASSASRTPGLVESLRSPAAAVSREPRPQMFGNDLEPVTRRLFPAFDRALEQVRQAVPHATMTGTGAALFVVFPDVRSARSGLEAARGLGFDAWLCRPVPESA